MAIFFLFSENGENFRRKSPSPLRRKESIYGQDLDFFWSRKREKKSNLMKLEDLNFQSLFRTARKRRIFSPENSLKCVQKHLIKNLKSLNFQLIPLIFFVFPLKEIICFPLTLGSGGITEIPGLIYGEKGHYFPVRSQKIAIISEIEKANSLGALAFQVLNFSPRFPLLFPLFSPLMYYFLQLFPLISLLFFWIFSQSFPPYFPVFPSFIPLLAL